TDNRTLTHARGAAKTVEGWLQRFSLDGFLHEIGHRWKYVSSALLSIAIFLWFSTSFIQIESNEVGIVRRFGEVRDDLHPGLHIRWPWPIESVTRVRPDEVRTVEIGFRVVPDAPKGTRSGPGGNTWTSGHSDGIATLTDEAVMITGDG